MYLGVDDEGSLVDRPIALDDLSLVVDQQQVGHADLAEMHREGIDPEVVAALRVPSGDVAGNPFVEPVLGEQTERRR